MGAAALICEKLVILGMPNSLRFPKFEPFSMLYTYGFQITQQSTRSEFY